MADFRVVCTEQVPANEPKDHAHIVAVGVGDDPEKAAERMTLDQVIARIDAGDRFYTRGVTTGRVAWIEKVPCPTCRRVWIIRTQADAVWDNNLDGGVRRCRSFGT